jgi:hypothetical protein
MNTTLEKILFTLAAASLLVAAGCSKGQIRENLKPNYGKQPALAGERLNEYDTVNKIGYTLSYTSTPQADKAPTEPEKE